MSSAFSGQVSSSWLTRPVQPRVVSGFPNVVGHSDVSFEIQNVGPNLRRPCLFPNVIHLKDPSIAGAISVRTRHTPGSMPGLAPTHRESLGTVPLPAGMTYNDFDLTSRRRFQRHRLGIRCRNCAARGGGGGSRRGRGNGDAHRRCRERYSGNRRCRSDDSTTPSSARLNARGRTRATSQRQSDGGNPASCAELHRIAVPRLASKEPCRSESNVHLRRRGWRARCGSVSRNR